MMWAFFGLMVALMWSRHWSGDWHGRGRRRGFHRGMSAGSGAGVGWRAGETIALLEPRGRARSRLDFTERLIMQPKRPRWRAQYKEVG
jgi:hypothetical protein